MSHRLLMGIVHSLFLAAGLSACRHAAVSSRVETTENVGATNRASLKDDWGVDPGLPPDIKNAASAVPLKCKPSDPQLDALFGEPCFPLYYKRFETNADSSPLVNPTLQTCSPGQPLIASSTADQIWAVRFDGSLVIGDELPVKDSDGSTKTLGHPTLTGARPARIAGEIRWKGGSLVISNASGRYSHYPDRDEKKLANVVALFQACGLTVKGIMVKMSGVVRPDTHATPYTLEEMQQ